MPTDESQAYRPFCSARCRAADLGKWLDGGYRISTPADQAELDDGGQGEGHPSSDVKLPQ